MTASNAIPDIASNLAAVQQRLVEAARAADRNAEEVTLVAVGKTFGAERILPALDAGHRVFGENRVQEALEKWPPMRDRFPDLELHLIGPLQSNKVKKAIEIFDVIETIDRPKLARAVAAAIKAQAVISDARPVTCFIQVNTGAEDQKAGVLPGDVDEFVKVCREDIGLPVSGLMCIPPVDEEPALHFGLLSEMAKRNGLAGLSMGMSADFETAVAFGATHVRVGSAIFGVRAPLAKPA